MENRHGSYMLIHNEVLSSEAFISHIQQVSWLTDHYTDSTFSACTNGITESDSPLTVTGSTFVIISNCFIEIKRCTGAIVLLCIAKRITAHFVHSNTIVYNDCTQLLPFEEVLLLHYTHSGKFGRYQHQTAPW